MFVAILAFSLPSEQASFAVDASFLYRQRDVGFYNGTNNIAPRTATITTSVTVNTGEITSQSIGVIPGDKVILEIEDVGSFLYVYPGIEFDVDLIGCQKTYYTCQHNDHLSNPYGIIYLSSDSDSSRSSMTITVRSGGHLTFVAGYVGDELGYCSEFYFGTSFSGKSMNDKSTVCIIDPTYEGLNLTSVEDIDWSLSWTELLYEGDPDPVIFVGEEAKVRYSGGPIFVATAVVDFVSGDYPFVISAPESNLSFIVDGDYIAGRPRGGSYIGVSRSAVD